MFEFQRNSKSEKSVGILMENPLSHMIAEFDDAAYFVNIESLPTYMYVKY